MPTPVHAIRNKLRTEVPNAVLGAICKHQCKYTDILDIFYCIQIDHAYWVGVIGDGDMGSYEWFDLKGADLVTSEMGYGNTLSALRDVLNGAIPE